MHPSLLTGKRNASNRKRGPPPKPKTNATQVRPTTIPGTTEHATSTIFTTDVHSTRPETTGTAVQTTKGNKGKDKKEDKKKKLKETSDRLKKAKNVCKKTFFNHIKTIIWYCVTIYLLKIKLNLIETTSLCKISIERFETK